MRRPLSAQQHQRRTEQLRWHAECEWTSETMWRGELWSQWVPMVVLHRWRPTALVWGFPAPVNHPARPLWSR